MVIINRKTRVEASITVEASLVLPIFILAMYAFIFLIQVFMVQDEVQHGLLSTARYCEKIGYVYDYIMNYDDEVQVQEVNQEKTVTNNELEGNNSSQDLTNTNSNGSTTNKIIGHTITSSMIRVKFHDTVNQAFINQSCITSGMSGLSFSLSSYDDSSKMVDIIVRYQVHLPLGCIRINDFKISQRVKVRIFVGSNRILKEKVEEEDEEYVYITETGTAYHETPSCTHIKLSIHKVSAREIDVKRNNGGAKYYPCEKCKPTSNLETSTDIFYITNSGDRYHCLSSCSGLKRTVKKIKRSEVGNRHACTRCCK